MVQMNFIVQQAVAFRLNSYAMANSIVDSMIFLMSSSAPPQMGMVIGMVNTCTGQDMSLNTDQVSTDRYNDLTKKSDSCSAIHYFKCDTSRECIPRTQFCDGQINCDDGSDEAQCTCTPDQFHCANLECISRNQFKIKKITRSEVRTHAGIPPLELKSNALTTRPSWCANTDEDFLL